MANKRVRFDENAKKHDGLNKCYQITDDVLNYGIKINSKHASNLVPDIYVQVIITILSQLFHSLYMNDKIECFKISRFGGGRDYKLAKLFPNSQTIEDCNRNCRSVIRNIIINLKMRLE